MTNIKELALKVAREMPWPTTGEHGEQCIEFATRLFAAWDAKAVPVEIDWPEYHEEAMGCGLEDRNTTDRYEAMRHGWDCAIERCAEAIPEVIYSNPLPLHDLVAEIESLNSLIEYHVTNQKVVCEEIQKLRQQLSAAEKEMMMLRDALNLLYSWANNWDSEFMNDPDWKNRDLLIVQKALVITGD